MQGLIPLVLITLVAIAAGAVLVTTTPAPIDEPLADINHAIHIERDLECSDCHTGVESHPAAGVPSIKICAECHEDAEDAIRETPNGKRVLDHVLRGEELWWPLLYTLPHHVVFSHRRHVALGKIACEECHGEIASSTTLPREPVQETLTMDGCIDCHARSGADVDCYACHK